MQIMVRTQREKDKIRILINGGKARIIARTKTTVPVDAGKGRTKTMNYEVWTVELISKRNNG
jgi:hypothetical protein